MLFFKMVIVLLEFCQFQFPLGIAFWNYKKIKMSNNGSVFVFIIAASGWTEHTKYTVLKKMFNKVENIKASQNIHPLRKEVQLTWLGEGLHHTERERKTKQIIGTNQQLQTQQYIPPLTIGQWLIIVTILSCFFFKTCSKLNMFGKT